MDYTVLSVADQNILFSTEEWCYAVLDYFKEGTNPTLLLRTIQSSQKYVEALGRVSFESHDNFSTHQSMILRNTSEGINTHGVTMALAYLTDINSDKYNAIHGCGMVIKSGNKERGILLIGRHGHGKTTLGNALGKNQTLDDDILMINNNGMQTVGRYGAITHKKLFSREKWREHQIRGITQANIDAIFILDKRYRGGHIQEEERHIPRRDSAIDALGFRHYSLLEEKPPIQVSVPVYRLGTNHNLWATKKAVHSVL
jgi:hypothetical protein